jgi:hypothetical protein
MAILILEEKTKEVYHCICIVWSTIFTRDFIRLLRNQLFPYGRFSYSKLVMSVASQII